jgi:predicted RNA-binding protein YlxR (DUF448 family)
MRRKHIPQRTCVGCREVEDKRRLTRLVRTPEGTVEIDETGKRPGRGAYLHRRLSCWQVVLQSRRLEIALQLKGPLTKENLDLLKAYAATLPEEIEEVAQD